MSDSASDSPDRPGAIARAQSAMLAAACGDALGWPIEPRGRRVGGVADVEPRLQFIEWRRREGGGYAPFERDVPPGAYSDDTQLMLAVARSLTVGDGWWDHLTAFELPAWGLYELGGGGALKKASRSWARGQAPWEAKKASDRKRYFAAGANGVAMRVLPHAIFGAEDPSFESVSARILADGIATHGHPRALVGALAAGYAMWVALRWSGKVNYGELVEDCLAGREAWTQPPDQDLVPGWKEAAQKETGGLEEDLWRDACEEMTELLSVCMDAMKRGSLARDNEVLERLGVFSKEGGAGTRTAAAAIYLAARYVAKPSAGLLAAAFARRADTDTIACVAGAMLGAFSEDARVDGLATNLQDRNYVANLAEQVATRELREQPSFRWTTEMKSRVQNKLAGLDHGGSITLPLFGDCTVQAVERPETKSANEVTIWWLSTDLGQTLAVTKIKKLDGGKEPRNADSGRDTQMTLKDDESDEAARAESTWTFVFVTNLSAALDLYHVILGIPIIRVRDNSAVLRGHLVLEEVEDVERNSRKKLRDSQLVGVFVRPQALRPLMEQATAAGYDVSDIALGRNGERFRVQDKDGHIIEVFTSQPSS